MNNEVPATAVKSSHPVDLHVGVAVRIRRKSLGMSQGNLADKLGLTFQQVQKYERGLNRISASKLFEISRTLKMPIERFFEGIEDTSDNGAFSDSASERNIHQFLLTADGISLAQTFPKIKTIKVRRKLLDLVIALSEHETD